MEIYNIYTSMQLLLPYFNYLIEMLEWIIIYYQMYLFRYTFITG